MGTGKENNNSRARKGGKEQGGEKSVNRCKDHFRRIFQNPKRRIKKKGKRETNKKKKKRQKGNTSRKKKQATKKEKGGKKVPEKRQRKESQKGGAGLEDLKRGGKGVVRKVKRNEPANPYFENGKKKGRGFKKGEGNK